MSEDPKDLPPKRVWTKEEAHLALKKALGDSLIPDESEKPQPSGRTWTQKEFEALLKEVAGNSLTLAEPNTEQPKTQENQTNDETETVKFEVRYYQHPPAKKLKPVPREHWCDRFLQWLLKPLDF